MINNPQAGQIIVGAPTTPNNSTPSSYGGSVTFANLPSASLYAGQTWWVTDLQQAYYCNGSTWTLIPKAPVQLATDANNNVTGIVNPKGGISNFTSLYDRLVIAKDLAEGKNPFDFTTAATQPLVTAVTVDAAAYATPVSYGYFDAGGYDKIKICGIPYKDTNLITSNNGGFLNMQNPSGPSGAGYAGMAQSQNMIGSQMMMARVTCSSCQINVSTGGNSSNYLPIWVNGIAVSPVTPSAPTTNLQIAFAARGTYDIAVGFEQIITVKGITVDADDTVYPLTDVRVPVVVFGDSYTQGITSAQAIGGISLGNALSWIGGINAITHGVTGTGYVADVASSGIPMTFAGRLQYIAALVNAANAPLILIPAGYNDASIAATSASVQTAATTIANYLLANTSANILMTGSQPGQRNNSVATQIVDAGILAAVTAINTNRLAFSPVSGAVPPWITGTRDTAHTTGLVAGNSRYYTGADSIHLSPFITANPNLPANQSPSSGVEYYARKLLDVMTQTVLARNW